MAKRELVVILLAAIGGSFLVGCACNKDQFPAVYANLSGADQREAMKIWSSRDCASDPWTSRVQEELSGLNSNLSGADWHENVAGSCGRSVGANPSAPER